MTKDKIDVTPKELDLVLYSGDGVKFNVIVTDFSDEAEDITGALVAQIRKTRGSSGDPDAEFDVDLAAHASGIAVISLPGSATHDLADKTAYKGFWDLQWTPSGEEPRTIVQGEVEVKVDVTR